MKREPAITVKSLKTGYRYNKAEVIVSSDVNETLYSGELTCLIGPNGSGKSTILKTLSAFIPPLGGYIEIKGKNITDYTDLQLARVIGVVLTDRLSLSNMTVEELVCLGRSPYTGFLGKLSEKDYRIVDESLKSVSIEDLRNRKVQTLSDGERQKVMIAKALAQETPVIFLDEPTAFLDYPSKAEILQLLKKLSRLKQKTVFLSTHDLELALQIADKIWLIDKRLGIKTGTPEDLAMSGDMARYFERDGMRFDAQSGLFKIHTPAVHTVFSSGSGIKFNMIQKALFRNGIKVVPFDQDCKKNAGERIIIGIEEYGYTVNGNIYKDIGELSDAVIDLIKRC